MAASRTSGKKSGKILEVRGLPGNSVDRDRHVGFREVMEGPATSSRSSRSSATGTRHVAEGDRRCARRAQHFDGVFTQGGSTGTVRRSWTPSIPSSRAGEGENGFRKLIAESCQGRPEGPVLRPVAGAGRRSRSRRRSRPSRAMSMPQLISVPIPVATTRTLKAGENYWPDLEATISSRPTSSRPAA